MNTATQSVVPNVFVKQACMGNKWAAQGAWVHRRPEFNGFSPFEVWDHPELMLSEQQRMDNPSMGAFTLVTVRSVIVRTIAALYSKESKLPVARIGGLPFVVRDEDPASLEGILSTGRRVMPQDFDVPGTFNRLSPIVGAVSQPTNGHRRVAVIDSMLLTERQRQKSRHRGRPRSSAFRSRN